MISSKILQNVELNEAIKNRFRKCGLLHVTPDVMDYNKCIQNITENLPFNKVSIIPSNYFRIADYIKAIESNLSNQGVGVQVVI